MSKRFISILLALCMVLAVLPVSALAAEGDEAAVNGTSYGTVQAAIDAAQNGETVTLLKSVQPATTIRVSGKNITLNLDEFTIDGGDKEVIYVLNGATLTIESGVNGSITTTSAVAVRNLGTLVVESGTITAAWYSVFASSY